MLSKGIVCFIVNKSSMSYELGQSNLIDPHVISIGCDEPVTYLLATYLLLVDFWSKVGPAPVGPWRPG